MEGSALSEPRSLEGWPPWQPRSGRSPTLQKTGARRKRSRFLDSDACAGEAESSGGDVEGGVGTAQALGVVLELIEARGIFEEALELDGEGGDVVDLDGSAIFEKVVGV